jgi:hypothetical protein
MSDILIGLTAQGVITDATAALINERAAYATGEILESILTRYDKIKEDWNELRYILNSRETAGETKSEKEKMEKVLPNTLPIGQTENDL